MNLVTNYQLTKYMGMGHTKQVTSLDLSKKLRDLGVEQKSLWHWFIDKSGIASFEAPILKDEWIDSGFNKDPDCSLISAFTVAELGEILPSHFHSFRRSGDGLYCCEYDLNLWKIEPEKANRICAETEAEARGQMVVYLLENKIIEL